MSALRLTLLLLAMVPIAAVGADCPAALPDTMRAIQHDAHGGPETLQLREVPRPSAAKGEVLVRVRNASVNPIDWKLREGSVRDWWPLSFPAVPGRDVSGDVVQVGEGVTTFGCGDAVAGFLGRAPESAAAGGGYAEYVALDARRVVTKPGRIDYPEAAAFPLVGVTAWTAVVELARVTAGERVLVQGGAGGVGSLALQIAKARGAHVITTASKRNHDFVRSLGADEAIDYTAVRFEDATAPVDVVIDTVGGETLARSPAVLKDGGRLVTIAGAPPPACRQRITCPDDRGDPDLGAAALRELASMLEAGTLRVNVDRVFPLEEAAQAQELNRAGHTRGKIVLEMK